VRKKSSAMCANALCNVISGFWQEHRYQPRYGNRTMETSQRAFAAALMWPRGQTQQSREPGYQRIVLAHQPHHRSATLWGFIQQSISSGSIFQLRMFKNRLSPRRQMLTSCSGTPLAILASYLFASKDLWAPTISHSWRWHSEVCLLVPGKFWAPPKLTPKPRIWLCSYRQ
jgi:hypothetical protein